MMPTRQYELEVGARTVEDLQAAWRGGAQRVELYVSPTEGALTPSAGFVKAAMAAKKNEQMNIDIFVMIRPRSGDMLYSDSEFEIMKNDTEMLYDAGAEGFMCGILTRDGELDIPRMREIIKRCGGRRFTLHRAFDAVRDQYRVLEQAIDLGIEYILTGGFLPGNLFDFERLSLLSEKAAGRIKIMAALGPAFKTSDIPKVIDKFGVNDYHIINGFRKRNSGMRFIPGIGEPSEDYLAKGINSVEYLEESTVREIRDYLNQYQS